MCAYSKSRRALHLLWAIGLALGFATTGFAQVTGWDSRDIGTVGQPGSASMANGTYTVSGAGSDILGNGRFVSLPLAADRQLSGRLLGDGSRSRSLLPAVTLALSTGLRHNEVRLLKWAAVDLANESLIVGKSKTAYGTGRPVPLNARAVKALTMWALEFPHRKPSHYVFPSEKVGVAGDDRIASVFDTTPEKPIGSWKVAWTTAREQAGVSCRFHDLRHTTVTRLLERGVAFAVVATIMGWSPATSVRMAKRYGHIGQSAQREAMALLDREAGAAPESQPTVQ